MIKNYFIFLGLLFLLMISSCKQNSPGGYSQTLPSAVIKKNEAKTKRDSLKQLNSEILQLFKQKDYGKLAEYIGPKGVRFSMYAFIDTANDKHFSQSDFVKYANTDVKFTWGKRDGTGEPLVLSIRDYLEKWVFNKDFTTGEYAENQFIGSGNSLNNLQKIYLKAAFTENYLKGTDHYSGMDWQSLRLVFEKIGGKYYLIAVVNDRWTI